MCGVCVSRELLMNSGKGSSSGGKVVDFFLGWSASKWPGGVHEMRIMMSRLCKLVFCMCSCSCKASTMANMAEFRQTYQAKLVSRSVISVNGQCLYWTGATSRSRGAAYSVINCKWEGRSRWSGHLTHHTEHWQQQFFPDMGTVVTWYL